MGAAASASSVVTTALHGDVLVVTIDNPPVNALGAAVRQGLLAALQQAQADAAVAAVLLVGAARPSLPGPTFANLASRLCPRHCPRFAAPSKARTNPWWPCCTVLPWVAGWKWRSRPTTAWRCPPPRWACPK